MESVLDGTEEDGGLTSDIVPPHTHNVDKCWVGVLG